MRQLPKPPETFVEFSRRFPKLAEAWQLAGDSGRDGPLDDRAGRLVKLAIAVGAMRQGAVSSAVRKALAAGVTAAEVEQVIALAASTIGFPGAVAVFSWVRDDLDRAAGKPPADG